ncbi:unnamed protein product, partial [Adineta steineri]
MFKLDSHSKIFIYLIDIFSRRYSIGFSFKDIRMSGFSFRSLIFIHLDLTFAQRYSFIWISFSFKDIHPLESNNEMFPTPDLSHFKRNDYNEIYEPDADSFLLLDALELKLNKILEQKPFIILEFGCG